MDTAHHFIHFFPSGHSRINDDYIFRFFKKFVPFALPGILTSRTNFTILTFHVSCFPIFLAAAHNSLLSRRYQRDRHIHMDFSVNFAAIGFFTSSYTFEFLYSTSERCLCDAPNSASTPHPELSIRSICLQISYIPYLAESHPPTVTLLAHYFEGLTGLRRWRVPTKSTRFFCSLCHTFLVFFFI